MIPPTRIHSLFSMIFLILLISISSELNSQEIKDKEIKDLIATGYKIHNIESIMLWKGEQQGYYFNLSSNVEYVILGYSADYGVQDIDLFIFDNEGNLIKRDTHYHTRGKLFFKSPVSLETKIEVLNFKCVSDEKPYKCNIVVASKM